MRTYSPSEAVDIIVIGTGAGGAPVLATLAKAGLSVVALEAGPWFDPALFPSDEYAQSPIYWSGERLTGGDNPLEFGLNNSGFGVGGSTLHFGAYSPRPWPDDFRLRSQFGQGMDWPFGYSDLRPYFEQIEKFLGVSGPSVYPWGPDRQRQYPLPPLAFNRCAQLMEEGCKAVGLRTAAAPISIISRPYFQEEYGERKACNFRGFCHQGCRVGAKASMDVTYVPAAVKAGAEIRPGCFAIGFERDDAGRITAVLYRHADKVERQKCRGVFLCAGAVESPRLLLANNLANSSGQVGRNFMAHTAVQLWGTFTEEVRAYKGIPASCITEDTMRPAGVDFAGGYLIQNLAMMPVTWALQVARGRGYWGERFLRYLQSFNHVAALAINGECLPHPENYLELSTEVDETGLPKPRIQFSFGENEKRLLAHARRTMSAIWDAVGATDTWFFDRSAHVVGTCRLGTNRQTSVVDSYCKSFDVQNLWICDNSVFPSCLAANPTLNIIAISLRAAQQALSTRFT